MKNIFWDINKMLSFNAFLNIVIGERGVGKTYSAKKFVINRFLKKKKQFVYIRRYESDLEESVGKTNNNKFFEQVRKEFKDHEFKITKSKKVRSLWVDDEICGYALPLSSADSLKSSSYENVDTIIYDEFMLGNGSPQKYLKNEVEVILDLIETVGRLRDTRIILLGNAISSTSPIMSYFNLTIPYNSEFKLFKDGLILVNYIKNEKYREVKKNTRYGRLVMNTKYGDYAIDNVFLSDNKAFIEKKSKVVKFICRIVFDGVNYGIWYDKVSGFGYVSFDYDPNCMNVLTTDVNSHDKSTVLISSKVESIHLNFIRSCFKSGKLRFEGQRIKNTFMDKMEKYLI